jgi:hypothetical protein
MHPYCTVLFILYRALIEIGDDQTADQGLRGDRKVSYRTFVAFRLPLPHLLSPNP